MTARRRFSALALAGLLVASRVGGAGLNFLTQLMLAHLLGAAEFGVYATVFAFAGVLSVACSLGFPSVTSRFVSEYRHAGRWDLLVGFVRSGRAAIVLASLATAAPLLAGAFLLDASHRYLWPLILAVATAPALSLLRFNGSLANAFRRFIQSYLPDLLIRPALFLVVIAAFYELSYGLTASTALAIHLVIIWTLALAQTALVGIPRDQSGNINAEYDWRLWQATAAPLILVVLFTTFFADAEIALLGLLLPASDVAVFAVSIKVALLIAFGIQAIEQITLPDLSDSYARGDLAAVRRAVSRSNHMKFWPALAGFVAIWIGGEPLLALFGPEFARGHTVLVVLTASQLIRAAAGPVTPLLTLSGRQKLTLPVFGVSMVGLIALNVTMVPLFGLLGAAWAVLAVTLGWTSCLAILLNRQTGLRSWLS